MADVGYTKANMALQICVTSHTKFNGTYLELTMEKVGVIVVATLNRHLDTGITCCKGITDATSMYDCCSRKMNVDDPRSKCAFVLVNKPDCSVKIGMTPFEGIYNFHQIDNIRTMRCMLMQRRFDALAKTLCVDSSSTALPPR